MKRFGALTAVAILMAASLLGGLLSITGEVQAAWSGTGTTSPGSAYPNQTVEFRFDFVNTGEKALTISKAVLEITWGKSASTLNLRGNLTVEIDGRTNLTGTLTIPDIAPGDYSGNVTITAKASGILELSRSEDYPFVLTIDEVPLLHAAIQASPGSGDAPLTVSFSSDVLGGVGPYTYAWSFGDGTSGSNATLEHQYTKSGEYAVKLVVTDSLGNKASANTSIAATLAQLAVSIHSTEVNGVAPLSVTITSTVTGGTAPYSYSWTTGDGGTFDGDSFAYEYHEDGTYFVRLVVTDADGATARDVITIVVLSESEQAIDPVVETPLDLGPVMIIYIFVFVIASVSVVGFMIYRNRTRFRR